MDHITQLIKVIRSITKTRIIDFIKKPMIYTGGGVVLGDASEELTKLIKKLDFQLQALNGLRWFPANENQF